MASFRFGVAFHATNAAWASTLWHGMVHIMANLGNVVLYSGHIATAEWLSAA
jgi:hypothetical protein